MWARRGVCLCPPHATGHRGASASRLPTVDRTALERGAPVARPGQRGNRLRPAHPCPPSCLNDAEAFDRGQTDVPRQPRRKSVAHVSSGAEGASSRRSSRARLQMARRAPSESHGQTSISSLSPRETAASPCRDSGFVYGIVYGPEPADSPKSLSLSTLGPVSSSPGGPTKPFSRRVKPGNAIGHHVGATVEPQAGSCRREEVTRIALSQIPAEGFGVQEASWRRGGGRAQTLTHHSPRSAQAPLLFHFPSPPRIRQPKAAVRHKPPGAEACAAMRG